MTPDGWYFARLGTLSRVNPEQLENRTDPDYVLEYLDIAAIDRPGVIGASRLLTFKEAPSRARRRARTGDILVSTVRPYLRNFASVRGAPSNLVASTGYAVVRPMGDVDGAFLYQHVLSDAFVEFLKPRMSGSNYPAVKKDDVEAYTLSVPPLPEQHKIAAILSSLDDAIEKTQAVIDQVQVVKRGLMQELLTRGLPGRHTRFKQTEIGEIPADWRVVRVGQIGAIEAGRQRSPWAKGERRPYLRVANVYDGYIDTTSLLSMPFTEREFSRYKLALGDLLLNEGQSRELVGRCAEYAGHPPECCFQNTLVRFQAGDQVTARFAFWVFRHYFYSGVFSDIARQTTSVAHLGVRRFADILLALPSLAEQVKISENIEMIGSREDSERDKLGQLSVVKSALMSVLLTGELRVTPDPATA